jgi:hypothetical protein
MGKARDACHLSYTGQEDHGPVWSGQKETPISKISRAKSAGGGAEVVEYLPRKCKTLHYKPSTTLLVRDLSGTPCDVLVLEDVLVHHYRRKESEVEFSLFYFRAVQNSSQGENQT